MSFRSIDRAALALFALLVFAPVAASLAYAALYSVGLAGLLAPGLTTDYIVRVARDPEARAALIFTLAVSTVVVALTAAIALPLSIAVRGQLGRGGLVYALTLPLAIPGIVAGFLGVQFLSGSGWLSRLSVRLGFTADVGDFPRLIHDPWGLGIAVAHVALAVPFFVLLFAELHESERVDALCELARMLGASRSQVLRRVVAPILLHQARPSLTLLFAGVLASFEIPLMLGGQRPLMASVLVFRKYSLFDVAQKPDAYVLALVFTMIAIGVAGRGLRVRPGVDAA